jgi:hypothetical protein
VRLSALTVTVLMTGGFLAACSLPAPEIDGAADGGARDIRLVEQPSADAPRVSDLEAGRVGESAPARPVVRARPAVRQAAAAPKVVEPEPLVLQLATATLTTPIPTAPDAAPAEEAPPEIIRAPVSSSWMGGTNGPLADGGGRSGHGGGPGIIIRGGRGGIDDDCDLHRPGFGGTGIAINRRGSIPVIGGGIARPGLRGRIR